jgi:hypothetical protein
MVPCPLRREAGILYTISRSWHHVPFLWPLDRFCNGPVLSQPCDTGILYTIYPPLFAALVVYSLGGTAVSVALGRNLVREGRRSMTWRGVLLCGGQPGCAELPVWAAACLS